MHVCWADRKRIAILLFLSKCHRNNNKMYKFPKQHMGEKNGALLFCEHNQHNRLPLQAHALYFFQWVWHSTANLYGKSLQQSGLYTTNQQWIMATFFLFLGVRNVCVHHFPIVLAFSILAAHYLSSLKVLAFYFKGLLGLNPAPWPCSQSCENST